MSESKLFEHQRIDGAVFRDCSMARSKFDDVNLLEAIFSNVNLQGCRFNDVNMKNVTMDDVSLLDAVFSNVNLQGGRFNDVNLKDVTIDDANIEGLTIFGYDIQSLIKAEMLRNVPD
jgi:uncharacterized protein YjbI with pentapeptide repeats